MANPQPTDPHVIITHDIQHNILIRNFKKIQLKIIYLIIRMSWGCRGCKAWQYDSYTDFKVIGLHKSDVSKQLKYLSTNKVIYWWPDYRLIKFNKNYDEWTIPIDADMKAIHSLVNKSLRKANEVSELLTVLEKNTNGVSDFYERSDAGNADVPTDTEDGKKGFKESTSFSISNTQQPCQETVDKLINELGEDFKLELLSYKQAKIAEFKEEGLNFTDALLKFERWFQEKFGCTTYQAQHMQVPMRGG